MSWVIRILPLLCCALLASHLVFAGENVWTTNGPPGKVFTLTIDSQGLFLYAGTRLGPDQTAAFRSSDRGASWANSGEAPPFTFLTAIAAPPTPAGAVYATTSDYFPPTARVFQSLDAGENWRFVSSIQSFTANSMTASTTGILYGAGSASYCSRVPCLIGLVPAASIEESPDSGVTWTRIDSGLSGWAITALALDPSDARHLFAGGTSGIFLSVDGGHQWTSSNAGLGECLSVTSLAVDPRYSNIVFAGTTWATGPYECGGVFRSRDGGRTWAPTPFRNRDVTALLIDPWNPDTLYAGTAGENPIYPDVGVFQSTDGGQTWARVGSELPGVIALVIEPSRRALHAASSAGVFDYEIVPGARPPVVPPRTRATRALPARP